VRLCTCRSGGRTIVTAEIQGGHVDLLAAHEAGDGASDGREWLGSLLGLVRGGERARDAAREAVALAERSGDARLVLPASAVRLLAPIPRPGKILCSGINYRGHLEENPGAKLPETPFFFSKLPSAVIGPGEPIVHPAATSQLDYEVELAVVIGRTLHRAREAEVLPAIAGYTILHDVSARDVQFKDNQITLGKNFDTFAPMGPCLVTPDEIRDPADLRLRSLVNGRVLQDSSTRDWVFPLPVLVASLSRVMTLEPGDVVTTGTPAGVGVFRKPPIFLKPGDTALLEIERVGRLENPVIAET
jgi:2,4-diketo-3-deoxy-L-fuconate hydrolase